MQGILLIFTENIKEESYKLVITFENEFYKNDFLSKCDLISVSSSTHKTISASYPIKERDDLVSLKYE